MCYLASLRPAIRRQRRLGAEVRVQGLISGGLEHANLIAARFGEPVVAPGANPLFLPEEVKLVSLTRLHGQTQVREEPAPVKYDLAARIGLVRPFRGISRVLVLEQVRDVLVGPLIFEAPVKPESIFPDWAAKRRIDLEGFQYRIGRLETRGFQFVGLQFVCQNFFPIEPVFDVLALDKNARLIELADGPDRFVVRRQHVVERRGLPLGTALAIRMREVIDEPSESGTLQVVAVTDGTRDIRREIYRCAVDNRWPLLELDRREASLEEVFGRLTKVDQSGSPQAGARAA